MTDIELNLALAKAAGIEVVLVRPQECVRAGSGKVFQPTHPTLGWNDAWEALQRWSDRHSRMEWLRLMDHLQEALSSEEMTPVSFERCMSGLLTKGPRSISEAIVAWKGTG